MECTCVHQTELPHTSRLFADYAYHFDRLEAFYPHPEHDLAACERAARAVAFPEDRRAALVEALRPLNPGSRSLPLLAEPGTVAVVTGQQVGLFSGPCYTVYKALTAVRLARDLTERGIPAVPVFWLATEDHDFAEVNHCWVFGQAHQPVKLQMQRTSAAGQPVGEVLLANPPVEELSQALAGLPFAEDAAAAVSAAYASGRTMGEAFSALLKTLLAPYDLIHVDPMSPAVRRLAAPALRAAWPGAADLSSALLERNRSLIAAGYHAQVHVEETTSLVFLLENGRRLALRRNGTEYVLNGRRFSTAELSERAHELSPNALLRPVVQDSMLPTAAYIGGPAELAYLAQSAVIYTSLDTSMPAAVPRAGFTVLDSRARKLMARYGLCLADFFQGQEALKERLAVRLIPPHLARVLAETKEVVEAAVGRLEHEVAAFDPTLGAALAKSRGKMLYQLAKSERKAGREMMARDSRAAADAAYLYGLIFPERHLQERVYSVIPFIARHGLELVDRIFESVRLDCPDHQLLTL